MNRQIKHYSRYRTNRAGAQTLLCGAALLVAPLAFGQVEEEIFELSPFTVEGSQDAGYRAASTLAGTRIRTDLKDVGSAISVYTEEFLRDTAATDNESLLIYTTNTEVGGPLGNFAGVGSGQTPTENFTTPSTNTRVRGLAAADNTRNYFLSSVPWDGYNVNRVDMQRGPNAILFGLGSPAGIINTTTDNAHFSNDNKVEVRFGSYGSTRFSFNANRVLMEDELSVRVAGVVDNQKFRQKPAFEDDERIYAAFRYDPKFLQGEGMSTSLKGFYENGSISSNRPRVLPPMDRITPFFRPVGSITTYQVGDSTVTRNYGEAPPEGGVPISVSFPQYGGVGGQLFDPYGIEDESSEIGLGENRARRQWPNNPLDPESDSSAMPNPNYIPMLGNFAQNFASPLMVFPNHASSGNSGTIIHEIKQHYGIGPDGSIDRGFSTPYGRIGSVDTYVSYATQAELPLYRTGTYRNIYLQDPTVFDFYNNLIDGPNKEEWNEFDDFNLNLSQTFFNNKLGYELAYYEETVDRGNVSVLGNGGNIALLIDTNSHLGDGSPNPNAGRAFISDAASAGNNQTFIKRDTARATVYGEYDFLDNGSDNFLTRLLGKHRFTGLYVEDNYEQDSRGFVRYRMLSDEMADLQLVGGYHGNSLRGTGNDYFSNEFTINTVHYLGDSLLGRNSASGAFVPRLSAVQEPTSGSVRLFDHRWAAPAGVQPNDWWDANGDGIEDLDPEGNRILGENQSENPANYVGWRDVPFSMVRWNQSPTAREDYGLYRSGSLSKSEIESEALVWQGFFWNGSVVGNYGWRKDTTYNWNMNAPQDNVTKVASMDPSVYNFNAAPVMESGQSQSWSVAVHLNQLLQDRLPVNVSLYYNESENFQPGAGRVDIYGEVLAAPSGATTDKSILIGSKDGRYTLKATEYETTLSRSSSPYLDGTWYMGNLVTWGSTWANIAEFDLNGDTMETRAPQNEIDNLQPGEVKRWAYADPELEQRAIAKWREFQAAIPKKWLDAWGIKDDLLNDVVSFSTNQGPAGLTYTEDVISKGYEFEFMAQPTDNWRISLNAAKTKAIRNNVGGESFKEWVDFIDSWIQDTDAGEIRVWWGSGERVVDQWNNNFRSNYSLLELLEGSSNPEIREWSFNLVTNYDFTEGVLSGFNVGGSYRWQDDIVIGYPVQETAEGRPIFDLDNPYVGPTEDALDLWVGYGKALTDKINWRVQLNVRNALGQKELIPIAVQPNGDWATVRIADGPTWQLTNTFTF